MIQMATMVISDATNIKIAAQKAALQNLRLKINNKTGQEIALGQLFKGIVEGRKFQCKTSIEDLTEMLCTVLFQH